MDPGSDVLTKAAAAETIAVEASRLMRMASAHDLPMLAYLLDMVVLEAWTHASEPDGGPQPGGEAAPAEA
jgi:hypothetical protein